jgi:hypothetical protein
MVLSRGDGQPSHRAREKSDRHGWFHFKVSPGRYKVRLQGSPYSTKTVLAREGRKTRVKLYGSVP